LVRQFCFDQSLKNCCGFFMFCTHRPWLCILSQEVVLFGQTIR
jgi:hypothetical protein